MRKFTAEMDHLQGPEYQVACPRCHAQPGEICLSAGQPYWNAHVERKRAARPALPDLSSWWKDMQKYEGQFAEPRPANLVVP